jgi:twitching motility protein PilT
MVELQKLLETVIEKKASDLHITTGAPPQFRVDGKLISFDSTMLNATDTKRLCYSLLTDAQRHKFEEENELDFSSGSRVQPIPWNIYMQRERWRGRFEQFPLTS